MSLQRWPSRRILSGVVLLLAQSIVLLGIFPWGTVTHNRDIQAGLSSFRDCGINGYFGVVLPAADPSSQLHPNESFNWILSQSNFSEISKMTQLQLRSQPILLFCLGQVTTVQQSCLCNKKTAKTHKPENGIFSWILLQFSFPFHFPCSFCLSSTWSWYT